MALDWEIVSTRFERIRDFLGRATEDRMAALEIWREREQSIPTGDITS